MNEWREVPLRDLVDVVVDNRGKTPPIVENGYELLEVNAISQDKRTPDYSRVKKFVSGETYRSWFRKGHPLPGDILVPTVGTIGNVALVRESRGAIAQNLVSLRFKGEVDSSYIYYFLSSSLGKDMMLNLDIGGVQPSIKVPHLLDMVISIPGYIEQKLISSVLNSLDDKIDLLHRQNKTIENIAETLFRNWFVEDVADANSGKIGDLIEDTFGGEWGSEYLDEYFDVPVCCIRGTDIADMQVGLPKKTPLRYVNRKKFDNIEPRNGDIIFEISGGTENQSTGRSIYINDDIKKLFQHKLVFSNFCRLLRPLKREYSYFIYLFLNYLYKKDEFFTLENGSSGIKNLNYKALLFDSEYPMPNEEKILNFDESVFIYFKKINANKQQIKVLENLRDDLLPKLMSGEVRVLS
ncbi:MAG TPA: hypothetical protein DCF93_12380 [Desulfuromonas sp.]|nr:hypothetical protein [Desulfuromonas sp.]